MERHEFEVFRTIAEERGGLAEIHSAFKEFPDGVAAHYEFYKRLVLADDLPLGRSEREFLALKTSETNECPYCIGHHRTAFENNKTATPNRKRALALESLARTLTNEPWRASALKSTFLGSGFNEGEWQHAIMIVGYFNFANRCAHAMNLSLEKNFESTCK